MPDSLMFSMNMVYASLSIPAFCSLNETKVLPTVSVVPTEIARKKNYNNKYLIFPEA